MKEIRAKRLNEDHKVEEYKGYELDFNTDLLDTEEESVVINVRVIDKNGKVLTTQRGFRKAREFVDKLVAEEERKKAEEEKRLQNFNVEVELTDIDKYKKDALLGFVNVNIDNKNTEKFVTRYIAKDESLDEEPWVQLDLLLGEKKENNKYGCLIDMGVYFEGDRSNNFEAVYEYDNKEESEFIENFDSDEPKWKPGAKERIEKLVKDFIKKEVLKTPIVKEEKMEENLYIHTDKNDKRLGIYDTKEETEEKWKDGDYILDVENQTLYKKKEKVEESKKLNEGAGSGYNAKGELYEIKIDKIFDIKTEVEEIEEYDPVSIATIKVEGTGKFDGTIADYYGNGAELEETEVKIKELSVNINIFEYTNNEEEDYQNITVEDLNNLFYGRVIKIRSKMIGSGWVHAEFTGKDISLKEIDESSYSLNDIVFDFVNEEDIKEVEYGLTHDEDEYEDDLEECFARELDEELTNKDIIEIEKELEYILKEHPEGHSIEVKTEEEKEYAKNRLKEKGYEVEVSGNDLADRYHIEYYKKELKENKTIGTEITVAKFKTDDGIHEIVKAENGRYFNHYELQPTNNYGVFVPSSYAGPYETEEEARTYMGKHRPTAIEIKEEIGKESKTKNIGDILDKPKNLQEYIDVKEYLFDETAFNWDEEGIIWAIQDYLSTKGEFSEEDKKTLEKYGFVEDDFRDQIVEKKCEELEESASHRVETGFIGVPDIEDAQSIVNQAVELFKRVPGGLYDDLDAAGFYVDADNKVHKKIEEDFGDEEIGEKEIVEESKKLNEGMKSFLRDLGKDDIQYFTLYNKFNYTLWQLRIDNKNKTYQKGQFTFGDRYSTQNGAEARRLIKELENKGYKEIKSEENLKESKNDIYESEDEIIVYDEFGSEIERFIEIENFDNYTDDEIVDELCDKFGKRIIIKRVGYDEENIPVIYSTLYENDYDDEFLFM